MDKNAFQKLLDTDQLLAAADVLVNENTTSKTARALRGRIIELEKQNNQGTINTDAYIVEKNRIRASLLDIMHGEPEELLHSDKGNGTQVFRKLLPILGLALLVIAALVYFNQNGKQKKVEPLKTETPKEEVTLPFSMQPDRSKMSLEDAVILLQKELSKKSLGFDAELVQMIEDKTYKQFVATLVRRYIWQVGFPVTISMNNVLVETNKETQKIVVTISRLKLGTRFSIGDKKVKTVKNTAWIEETSKDGDFWQSINQITKSKMKKDVLNNKAVTNRLREKATTLVINEINQILEGTGGADNRFEVIIKSVEM